MSMRYLEAQSDTLRIDYTAAIDAECRSAVLSSVLTVLGHYGYYHREHIDRVTGAYAVRVTQYDPDVPQPVSTARAAAMMTEAARDAGISMAQLRRMARYMAEDK